jgi:hypothetical protein
VFTARYGLNPYKTQIRLFLEVLKNIGLWPPRKKVGWTGNGGQETGIMSHAAG